MVGPLAAWIAGSADQWWADAGQPDPFTLTVVSGDDGPLAAAVLAAGPACGPALRYVAVDPDAPGRTERAAAFARVVDLEDPAFLYPAAGVRLDGPGGGGGAGRGGGADGRGRLDYDPDEFELEERPPARGIGPMVTLLTEVPVLDEGEGAVVALEVLSRQPFDLFERGAPGWHEVRIAATGNELVEIGVPAEVGVVDGGPVDAGPVDGGGVGGSQAGMPGGEGAGPVRWYRQTGAADWLRAVLPTASAGVLAVVDHWATGGGGPDTLDLDQLRHLRAPVHSAPLPVPGTSLSAVTWRLG
jgi:hypothetical protein